MAFKELEFTQSVWHYQVLKRKFWQETGFRVLGLYLQATELAGPVPMLAWQKRTEIVCFVKLSCDENVMREILGCREPANASTDFADSHGLEDGVCRISRKVR